MAETEVTETTVSKTEPAVVKTTTKTSTPPVQTEHPQKVYETKKTIFRTYQVIWYILGLIEILLIFRIVLKMLGANPSSLFVSFIYFITDPLAYPFINVFRVTAVQGAVFEWSTFIAIAVYALLAWGIIQLMKLIKPTDPEEVSRKVD